MKQVLSVTAAAAVLFALTAHGQTPHPTPSNLFVYVSVVPYAQPDEGMMPTKLWAALGPVAHPCCEVK